MASSIRSSRATRAPTYRAADGTRARSDSTTALRPATNSAASPAPRGVRRADGEPGESPRRRDPGAGETEADASSRRRDPEPEGDASSRRRDPEPEGDASSR